MKKIYILLSAVFLVAFLWSSVRQFRKRQQGILAIVHVSGAIRIQTGTSGWSGTDAEDTAAELHKLSEDKDVKAILLRINSPGGTVGSVQEIYREIVRCRTNGKKVVASLGDMAASGGYYLASGCDRIVSNPGTITGSIGVILQFGNLEGLFQKVGLKFQVIKSGIHKDIGSPARALTPEEKVLLQASIDDAYAQFVEVVREGRHLTPNQLKTIADGRIFTGRQALQAGLVDELGSQEDAIETAIRLSHLPARPFILSDRRRSLSSLLHGVASQMSRQPLDAFREAVAGASVEYQWHP